ncbi:hypothetical protein H9654_10905 [Stenotrophomonas sp. Sa5BUN4]|uniref:Uncharacterized protein n=1 Tax=Stenotrophomonas lacuserhaii TaxID=2760084 RepID=A0A8X8FT53_9GAMM|nr:hypothetical protein [Stenotrophomonas pennii]MBD7954707.1 hypothetical protein [Stenotrophomonas pennii]
MHILVIMLAPFLFVIPLSVGVAAATTRVALISYAFSYAALCGALPFAYGYLFMPDIRGDFVEMLSTAALIAGMRLMDLYAFQGLLLFKEKWKEVRRVNR